MAQVGRGVLWKKTRVDQCRQLDTRTFAEDVDLMTTASGYTMWKNSGASIGWEIIPDTSVRLFYTVTQSDGQKFDYSYYVGLERTPCYFGSSRWWWTCPKCHRRCRILYMPPGGHSFACRICNRLTYRSQQEGHRSLTSVFRLLKDRPRWSRRLNGSRSHAKRAGLIRKIRRVERTIRLSEPAAGRQSDE